MNKKVRVRFAPSPTGGLHIGGVRTVLFNYLFAKQHNGDFIVRIEDTDQTRFVEGAEDYILKTLEWCGLQPDESPLHGGPFAPYRQSERKPIYKEYAEQLVKAGYAYYAFDTAEDLDIKRKEVANFQYGQQTRNEMQNSLTLSNDAVQELLAKNTPHVVRIKIPADEEVKFIDMIRGEVTFNSSLLDDKVLLKADGMPTYHLAVVVDDFLMEITHAFRGEEWLPSAPVHVLLWQYLFGIDKMPQWAHLPLILKPDGNGKLSKRDGDRLGFPVFAMDWTNTDGTINIGFKERGFIPEAFTNMLAMLGWNSGTEQEIYSLQELIEVFNIERVHKNGAKFDFEKAKWFNHEWIKKTTAKKLSKAIEPYFAAAKIDTAKSENLDQVIDLVKDRCTLLTDFVQQAGYFFNQPTTIDISAIQPKWNVEKKFFFELLIESIQRSDFFDIQTIESMFKEIALHKNIKVGELQLPFRIMLVGEKFGPGVFEIAALLGKEETVKRINNVLALL